MISEKGLLIDLAGLREMQACRQIQVLWITTQQQIADCLTKAGACKQKLVDVLCQGKLNFEKILSC